MGYNSMGLYNFSDIFSFSSILILKSFGNSFVLCLLLIITLRFTCGEKKISSSIKMSQNIMNMFVDLMIAKEGIY